MSRTHKECLVARRTSFLAMPTCDSIADATSFKGRRTKARFIEPMLLRTEKLPQGADWLYEIKLDGYRILAIKSEGDVRLRSRNDNDFTFRYAQIASALDALPDETVIDGEVVALGKRWSPVFHYSASSAAGNKREAP